MLLKDLTAGITIIENTVDLNLDISGICYDSRILRNGELFIAVRGYLTDGHKYINSAAEKGAVCVICEEKPQIMIPYILVADARKTLALISAAWFSHPADKLKIIGVTGTNGKTSVTCLIKHIIEKCSHDKVGLIGTNGNFIGDRELPATHTTPESYEFHGLLEKMVLEGCKYVIMEVSSHALYLNRVYGIMFEIGVFTNLTPDHLDFHDSMENYAKAKAKLFASSARCVINIDDEYSTIMTENANGPVITYAVNNGSADLVGKDIKLHNDKTEFCIISVGTINRVELPVPALFSVYNALASAAVAVSLGFEMTEIANSFQSYEGIKGRAEIIPTGHDFTVMVDYAHTPDALNNIISSVRTYTKGKVVTLFGCGGDRDVKKRPLMGRTVTELSDIAIITTDNPRNEEPGKIIADILTGIEDPNATYTVIENRREAIKYALERLNPSDVLIIAGKGHETYQIIGNEKIHFDDREVVADYLKEIRIAGRRISDDNMF